MLEPLTLSDFDKETARLEWAAKLSGASTDEIVELVAARERRRQEIAGEIFGPAAD